jgi:hypothetical protein
MGSLKRAPRRSPAVPARRPLDRLEAAVRFPARQRFGPPRFPVASPGARYLCLVCLPRWRFQSPPNLKPGMHPPRGRARRGRPPSTGRPRWRPPPPTTATATSTNGTAPSVHHHRHALAPPDTTPVEGPCYKRRGRPGRGLDRATRTSRPRTRGLLQARESVEDGRCRAGRTRPGV